MIRMGILRSVAAFLGLVFCSAATLSADSVLLTAASGEASYQNVVATYDVAGKLILLDGGKTITLPLKVAGRFKAQQRLLFSTDERDQAVRRYERAEATLEIDGQKTKSVLADPHQTIYVDASAKRCLFFPAQGKFSREELDLVSLPADALTVNYLLPGEEIAIGASWKHDEQTLELLLGLDAVGHSKVKSTLVKSSEKLAQLEIKGTLGGAVGGVATEIELEGRYYYDREREQIAHIELHLKEKRPVGHVGPGVEATSQLKMQITASKPVEQLAEFKPQRIAAADARRQLTFASSAGSYRLAYDRRWHVTGDAARLTIMRLVDRGELVAQGNIRVGSQPAKETPSLATFKKDVKLALDSHFRRFLDAQDSKDKQGRTLLRVVAAGVVDTLPVQWVYYLVQDQENRRATVVFTTETELIQRFGSADLAIIRDLDLLTASPAVAKTDTAKNDTPQTEANDAQEKSPAKAAEATPTPSVKTEPEVAAANDETDEEASDETASQESDTSTARREKRRLRR